jgi:hypothetical protein
MLGSYPLFRPSVTSAPRRRPVALVHALLEFKGNHPQSQAIGLAVVRLSHRVDGDEHAENAFVGPSLAQTGSIVSVLSGGRSPSKALTQNASMP